MAHRWRVHTKPYLIQLNSKKSQRQKFPEIKNKRHDLTMLIQNSIVLLLTRDTFCFLRQSVQVMVRRRGQGTITLLPVHHHCRPLPRAGVGRLLPKRGCQSWGCEVLSVGLMDSTSCLRRRGVIAGSTRCFFTFSLPVVTAILSPGRRPDRSIGAGGDMPWGMGTRCGKLLGGFPRAASRWLCWDCMVGDKHLLTVTDSSCCCCLLGFERIFIRELQVTLGPLSLSIGVWVSLLGNFGGPELFLAGCCYCCWWWRDLYWLYWWWWLLV